MRVLFRAGIQRYAGGTGGSYGLGLGLRRARSPEHNSAKEDNRSHHATSFSPISLSLALVRPFLLRNSSHWLTAALTVTFWRFTLHQGFEVSLKPLHIRLRFRPDAGSRQTTSSAHDRARKAQSSELAGSKTRSGTKILVRALPPVTRSRDIGH